MTNGNLRKLPSGRSVLKIGEHGEHAAAALGRLGDAQLGEHAAHVGFHGPAGDEQLVADRVVGVPLCHEAEDLAFPVGQRVERVPLPAAAQQLADDLGIDDALADAHPAQRVADYGRVIDAVLEQVSGSGRMIFEQGLGVAGFQVAG